MERTKGIFFTIISAIVFGFTPILVNMTFQEGNNPVMMSLFRGIMVLPVLWISLKARHIPLRVTRSEAIKLVILSLMGGGVTMVMLYSSYHYIAVGTATTLHFIYPIAVSVVGFLFLKEKITPMKIAALILTGLGVFLLGDLKRGASYLGLGLALTSGLTYAFYIIYMDLSGLKKMDSIKVTFYSCLINAVVLTFFAVSQGQLRFRLSIKVYLLCFIIALLTATLGTSFLQMGIRHCGPSTAAILSTFEPLTSIVLGWVIFHETLAPRQLVACFCILISVTILSLALKGEENS